MLLSYAPAVRLVALAAHWLHRSWIGAVDFRFVLDDLNCAPHRMLCMGMYVFWHEMLLFPAYTHCREVVPLISNSMDGEVIWQVVRFARGGGCIRGSTDYGGTDHGGRRAAWELVKAGRRRHLGLTVDSPIGPRRVASKGSAVIAARSGMPIIPVGFGVKVFRYFGPRGREIAFPQPGSRVWVVAGRQMSLAGTGSDAGRQLLQSALDAVQARAERLVRGEVRPPSGAMSLNAVREV